MLNSYTSPSSLAEAPYHLNTPSDEYDLNFCYEVPASLISNGVELVPLIPSLHAQSLFEQLLPHPITSAYLAYGPFPTLTPFLTFLEMRRRESGTVLFAIKDLQLNKPEGAGENWNLAGFIAVLKGDKEHMISEIGHIHILPPFQRSHVTTHSVGLLLSYLLNTAHCRRVMWYANSLNLPSVAAAKRMGFKSEGLLRWARILPRGKDGIEVPTFVKDDARKGRHDALLAICWDDWERETREHIGQLMGRKVEMRDADLVGR